MLNKIKPNQAAVFNILLVWFVFIFSFQVASIGSFKVTIIQIILLFLSLIIDKVYNQADNYYRNIYRFFYIFVFYFVIAYFFFFLSANIYVLLFGIWQAILMAYEKSQNKKINRWVFNYLIWLGCLFLVFLSIWQSSWSYNIYISYVILNIIWTIKVILIDYQRADLYKGKDLL